MKRFRWKQISIIMVCAFTLSVFPFIYTSAAENNTEAYARLPETSLLRGPVIPVLAVVGLLLFLIGWSIYKKNSYGDDTDEKKE